MVAESDTETSGKSR